MDQLLGWRIRLQEDDLISQQIDHTVLFLHVSFAEHISFLGLPFLSPSLAASMPGLPPRMRGKVFAGGLLVHQDGITPAYAGKRSNYHLKDPRLRDHPRVCGEKYLGKLAVACTVGSPPRMRGKVPDPPVEAVLLGITPAYAGKRITASGKPHGGRDHPRVCGEKANSE